MGQRGKEGGKRKSSHLFQAGGPKQDIFLGGRDSPKPKSEVMYLVVVYQTFVAWERNVFF